MMYVSKRLHSQLQGGTREITKAAQSLNELGRSVSLTVTVCLSVCLSVCVLLQLSLLSDITLIVAVVDSVAVVLLQQLMVVNLLM